MEQNVLNTRMAVGAFPVVASASLSGSEAFDNEASDTTKGPPFRSYYGTYSSSFLAVHGD